MGTAYIVLIHCDGVIRKRTDGVAQFQKGLVECRMVFVLSRRLWLVGVAHHRRDVPKGDPTPFRGPLIGDIGDIRSLNQVFYFLEEVGVHSILEKKLF